MQNPIEVEARQYEESAYATGYVSGYEAARKGSAAYALEYARHARQQDASNYARGYCDGFNAYAVECGSVAPTDDEIVKQLRRESDAARAIERQQDAARARRARPRECRAPPGLSAQSTTRAARRSPPQRRSLPSHPHKPRNTLQPSGKPRARRTIA